MKLNLNLLEICHGDPLSDLFSDLLNELNFSLENQMHAEALRLVTNSFAVDLKSLMYQHCDKVGSPLQGSLELIFSIKDKYPCVLDLVSSAIPEGHVEGACAVLSAMLILKPLEETVEHMLACVCSTPVFTLSTNGVVYTNFLDKKLNASKDYLNELRLLYYKIASEY